MTTQVYAGVREILAGPDWEPVAVTDHGAFFTIAGQFKGTAHSGSRKDWRSLAADLDRIARELEARVAEELAEAVEPEPEPIVVVEPEPEPAPAEPEPDVLSEIDALKDLVAEQAAEIERLRKEAADVHNFPENLSDKLSDWDVGANLTTADLTEDLAQLVTGEETLAQAVERMTPGLDELLDMAQALSSASLEKAIATIEPERANDWMERLFAERGRLRLARSTVDENLPRENLINKTVGVFGRVGAKR